jgi:ABC-type phosphate transport system substrate-binding protein
MFTLFPRLVDIGASDSLLNLWQLPCAGNASAKQASDIDNFPDIQMFPAVAGAIVPIYNIPELQSISNLTLVLARETLEEMFMGNIRVRIKVDCTLQTYCS